MGPLYSAYEHNPVLLSWQWSSESEYENWYSDSTAYHVEEQTSQGQRAYDDAVRLQDARRACELRFTALRPFLPEKPERKALCDIGCGPGAWVETMRSWGFEAYGIEPNPAYVGPWIEAGTWRDLEGKWDVVTMHDVFEHLTRPQECLAHLHAALRPNGTLVIEMPEWDSPHQRAAGMNWKHIRPRQHICLYSKGAAEEMFERAGFELVAFYRPLRGAIGKMTHVLQRAER